MARSSAFAIFLLVMLAAFGLMHAYIYLRLARDTGLPDGWRRLIGLVLAVAAVGVPLGVVVMRRLPFQTSQALATVLYSWMGISLLIFAAVALTDLARLLWASVGWASTLGGGAAAPPADPSRRAFVARALAGGAGVMAGTSVAAAVHEATGTPRVHEVPVRLARLPRALDGYTLAQISDLHVGPSIGEREVRRVVDLTNAMRPDAVVITGDLVDGSVADLQRATRHLARLEARHGVFFVTGNHEYYSGAGPWIEELRRYGIRTLRNEHVTLGDQGPGGATFDLAGVDDWSVAPGGRGRWPALEKALQGRDADRSLVLLAHQPRGVEVAVASGVELQLSGHTHGGQLFPWSLLVGMVYPYWKGLYAHQEGDRTGHIYVTNGTGFWGPPMRLGAPAEVAKLVLTV